MQTIGTVRRNMRKAYQNIRNWRSVGAVFGVTGGMAYRIVNDNYEPHDPKIRHTLNLPAYAPAPVCSVCGEVHTTKRCTKIKRQAHDLFAMPVKELAKMIEERS